MLWATALFYHVIRPRTTGSLLVCYTFTMQPLPVYDVVLLVPEPANQTAKDLSKQTAGMGTFFQLDDHSAYPHVSLYMANFTPEAATQAQQALQQLATEHAPMALAGERYGQSEHGMVEIFFRKTPEITKLQEAIVAQLNPLRTGLRELDPVGRRLSDYIEEAPAEARTNLEQYGYDEIGTFFRPHITFARLRQPEQRIDFTALPAPSAFSANYPTLALCVMGEHGTCTELVATYPLSA